jgi:hypothetical protein
MHFISKLLPFLFLTLSINGYCQKIVSGGPLQDNQANYDVKYYNITLDVDISNKSISGSTIIKIDIKENAAPK